MKRIVLVFLLFLMASFLFSNSFFSERYFEVKTIAPVSISTDPIGVVNLLQKEVVIDFTKIAETMPENGLDLSLFVSPKVETTVNIPNVLKIGPRVGMDVFGEMNLSKSLFDFIGIGNTINEPTNVSATAGMDLFYYYGLFVETKVHKLTVGFTPNMFVPVLSMSLKDMSLSLNNTEDGKFIINVLGNFQVYSNTELSQGVNSVFNNARTGVGFDLAGSVGWDFTRDFTAFINFRVPIVPGTYKKLSTYSVEFENEFSLLGSESDEDIVETDEEYFEEENEINPIVQDIDYKIYRPMKFNLGINYSPFGKYLVLNAFAGIGIQHPLMTDVLVYPEYYCNISSSFIGIFSIQFITGYLDRIFEHSIITSLNLRLVQVDFGVNAFAPDFIKSVMGAGRTAFVAVSIGF